MHEHACAQFFNGFNEAAAPGVKTTTTATASSFLSENTLSELSTEPFSMKLKDWKNTTFHADKQVSFSSPLLAVSEIV